MKIRQESGGRILVSLARGDDIRSCIEGLAADENIHGAEVSAIGAVENSIVGYYDLAKKGYRRQVFAGAWELVSLLGNITLLEGKPFLHAHVALGGSDFRLVGGHLFEAKVGAVTEMFLTRCDAPLLRVPCAAIGLGRWEP